MGRGIGIGVRLLRPDVAAEEGVGHIQATAAWSEQFRVAEDRSKFGNVKRTIVCFMVNELFKAEFVKTNPIGNLFATRLLDSSVSFRRKQSSSNRYASISCQLILVDNLLSGRLITWIYYSSIAYHIFEIYHSTFLLCYMFRHHHRHHHYRCRHRRCRHRHFCRRHNLCPRHHCHNLVFVFIISITELSAGFNSIWNNSSSVISSLVAIFTCIDFTWLISHAFTSVLWLHLSLSFSLSLSLSLALSLFHSFSLALSLSFFLSLSLSLALALSLSPFIRVNQKSPYCDIYVSQWQRQYLK